MLLRFGSARAQSPKHPCEDRLARVGGILVNGDDSPIKDLPKDERLETEESGDIWVRSTDGRGVLFVVADGVGGAPRGGDTSQLLVDRLADLAMAAAPVTVRGSWRCWNPSTRKRTDGVSWKERTGPWRARP